MNTSLKKALLATAMTATIAGPASANIPDQSIESAVQSAVTQGNVSVFVKNGLNASMSWTDKQITEGVLKPAAQPYDTIDSVVDLMTSRH